MIENKIKLVETSEVLPREDRLRAEVDFEWVSELGDAIAVQSLQAPITIDQEGRLIAGEHRLEAFRRNARIKKTCLFSSYKDWTVIPARVAKVDSNESAILELVENLLRKDMTWKEEAKGIYTFCKVHPQEEEEDNEDYSERIASLTGITPSRIRNYINIKSRIDHPQVQSATRLAEAVNIVARHRKRELDNVMDSVSDLMLDPFEEDTDLENIPPQNTEDTSKPVTLARNEPAPEPAAPSHPRATILNESFLDYAAQYTGPRFNFIHCDFPYGVNMDKSSMTNADAWSTYADSEDIYFALLSALLENKDRLLSANSVVMFWYSEKYGEETRAAFKKAGFKRWTHPLIWHKSCNSGILSDYRRTARHTYENAMVFTLGDPFIVSPVADSYSGPATKEHGHVSEKPEAVLHHFFRLFIDEYTKMLDPTAGSHTSLKAALEAGAEHVTGIELDPVHSAQGARLVSKARSPYDQDF